MTSPNTKPSRPKRPSEAAPKKVHLLIPSGKRTIEVRSDQQTELTAGEWKDLARHCFVNAMTAGEPFKVTLEGLKISCQTPEQVISLVEHCAQKLNLTSTQLAVELAQALRAAGGEYAHAAQMIERSAGEADDVSLVPH